MRNANAYAEPNANAYARRNATDGRTDRRTKSYQDQGANSYVLNTPNPVEFDENSTNTNPNDDAWNVFLLRCQRNKTRIINESKRERITTTDVITELQHRNRELIQRIIDLEAERVEHQTVNAKLNQQVTALLRNQRSPDMDLRKRIDELIEVNEHLENKLQQKQQAERQLQIAMNVAGRKNQ